MADRRGTTLPPFDRLTGRGQARRVRVLAKNALEHYDLAVERMQLMQHLFNTLFRLDTADGRRFVLRVNRAGGRSLTDIRSETAWLAALRRDTDLIVPEPLAARDGRLVVEAEAVGIPEPRHCVIFGWIPGRNVRRSISTRIVYLMGEAMARLHDHADSFRPPAEFTDLSLAKVMAYGGPEQLDADGPEPALTPERRLLLCESAARAQEAVDHLYQDRAGRRFIHADLHYGNIRLDNGQLHVIDFDDSLWGYPVQDIGISLFYLQHLPNFAQLRAAFMEGYRSLRPSPEEHPGQIDAMIVQRRLDLFSYLIQAENPAVRAMVPTLLERSEPVLREWLDS